MANNDIFFIKIYKFGQLIRFFNAVISSLALWLGATLAGSSTNVKVIHGMVVAFILTAVSNIHNDILDREIDRLNQPHKPLVKGVFSVKFAYGVLIIFFTFGLFITLFWEYYFTLVYGVLALLSFFYNTYGKKIPVLGNLIVAFIGAMVPLLGAKIGGSIEQVVYLSSIVFAVFFIREMIKDVQDRKGDLINGVKTLSYYLSLNLMKWLMVILICLSMVLLLLTIPIKELMQIPITLCLLVFCLSVQLVSIYYILKIDSYDVPIWGRLSSWIKFLLIVGIFTFLSNHYRI